MKSARERVWGDSDLKTDSYKTEMHCHTSEISRCSNETGAEVVEKYLRFAYSSVVITNHIHSNYLPGNTWREQIDNYFDAIELAKQAGGDRLSVLSGMELLFDGSENEFLVYGAKREYFYDTPDLFSWDLRRFYEFACEKDMIVIQAHPMRFDMELIPPDHVHGVELFNGSLLISSHNDVTEEWVKCFPDKKFIFTSGSDNHRDWQDPKAGILTDEPIRTDAELLRVLRSGDYGLICEDLGECNF